MDRPAMAAALTLALLLGLSAGLLAEEKVLVVNSMSQRKLAQKSPQTDSRTRVVSVKGKGPREKGSPLAGDLCAEWGRRHYCEEVGKTAYDPATGAEIGKVAAVLWKRKGEIIGRIGAHVEDADEPKDPAELNSPAPRSGFYYLVEDATGAEIYIDASRAALR